MTTVRYSSVLCPSRTIVIGFDTDFTAVPEDLGYVSLNVVVLSESLHGPVDISFSTVDDTAMGKTIFRQFFLL